MHGSVAVKALMRIAGAIARRPADAPRYLGNLRRPPLESGLPWFTFGAIDFLAGAITPQHRVFEYGCGGSTIFLAGRAARVSCVEHNSRWMHRVFAELAKRRLGNVDFRLQPAGRQPPLSDSAYCRALDRGFDVVVVDGWAMGKSDHHDQRAAQSRAACFARAEQFITPGGIIVLDDAWFLPDLKHHAKARHTFAGVGPWRIGASRTDVFLY